LPLGRWHWGLGWNWKSFPVGSPLAFPLLVLDFPLPLLVRSLAATDFFESDGLASFLSWLPFNWFVALALGLWRGLGPLFTTFVEEL
jgi:hypothetical protein